MPYNEFINSVVNQLQVQLGDSYDLTLRPINKNNGVVLSGLTIGRGKDDVKPTIYLEPYYEQYKKGDTVEEIVKSIEKLYRSTAVPSSHYIKFDMNNFADMQSRIMFRVINAEANKKLLEDVPYLPYLDLAVVFYIALDKSEDGQMTALIHNRHMQFLGVSPTDLAKSAYINTPREYPAQIQSMSDLLREIAQKNMGEHYDPALMDELIGSDDVSPLYVLSNTNGLYGASCMIYQDVLKDFADRIQADIVLLPSSVHEVLLTPKLPETSYEDLSSMVTSINRQEVSLEEQLSNQVYLFSREEGKLKIVSSAPAILN